MINGSSLVRPLCEAENEFLQVLVTSFSLRPKGQGLELNLSFGPDSPSIWLRRAKAYLLEQLPLDKRTFYQSQFDAALQQNSHEFIFFDPDFPLRFGNGGTLPIIRIAGADYYCLFFRDTHPVGWNIANGGASNLHDLLHPDAIIERELREELIVVDPIRGRRYVFDWHDARMHDHPDFALAHHLWMDLFRQQNLSEFDTLPLPLKWLPASDVEPASSSGGSHRCDSVRVKYADSSNSIHTGQGLLNINAEDFGIEFDRIAKLSVGSDAVFCDGEIVDRKLLNRVVGLFAVDKLDAALVAGETSFYPDRFFWNGEERTGDDLQEILAEYAAALHRKPMRSIMELTKETTSLSDFDLCPITRNVVLRYQHLTAVPGSTPIISDPNRTFDVFISFSSEDRQLARRVFDYLSLEGDYRVFFSDATMDHGQFARQIDRALDSAKAFVVVSSRAEYLYKKWVQYEWESFHNDMMNETKPDYCPFIAFTVGVNHLDLPRPFRDRQTVQADLMRLDPSLRKLKEFIGHPA